MRSLNKSPYHYFTLCLIFCFLTSQVGFAHTATDGVELDTHVDRPVDHPVDHEDVIREGLNEDVLYEYESILNQLNLPPESVGNEIRRLRESESWNAAVAQEILTALKSSQIQCDSIKRVRDLKDKSVQYRNSGEWRNKDCNIAYAVCTSVLGTFITIGSLVGIPVACETQTLSQCPADTQNLGWIACQTLNNTLIMPIEGSQQDTCPPNSVMVENSQYCYYNNGTVIPANSFAYTDENACTITGAVMGTAVTATVIAPAVYFGLKGLYCKYNQSKAQKYQAEFNKEIQRLKETTGMNYIREMVERFLLSGPFVDSNV